MIEYLPTTHLVQVLAPVLAPVFVIEPAAQSAHDATLEAVEYLPALHSLHELAPSSLPVFVTEPASHCVHDVLPATPAYLPAWQSLQAPTDDPEYCPAAHAVHVVAPSADPVFVIEPASHSVHDATLDAVE